MRTDRIYLKTINSDGRPSSYQDVGFVALQTLLRENGSQVGLSVEMDETGSITATHYLYQLVVDEDGCFVSINRNPTLPDNALQYSFSDTEKNEISSRFRDLVSNAVTVFQGKDPLIISSILRTLFSAGFISHPSWQRNLSLLSENQNKLEDIAHALFALHEAGMLMQKTLTDVVNHTTPWQCASALRYLTYTEHAPLRRIGKKPEKVLVIPYRKAQGVDSDMFDRFPEQLKNTCEPIVTRIVTHPFPEELSRIMVLLYHRFKGKPNLTIVNTIASISNKLILSYMGDTLSFLDKNNLLNEENCLALLNQFSRPGKFQHTLYTLRDGLSRHDIVLTQALFDWIMSLDDAGILSALLHSNPALARLLNEVATAGVPITQPIFEALCKDPEPANKSAVEILASTRFGRDFLRDHLKINAGNFLFGRTQILLETLQIQIEGIRIQDWLSTGIEAELEEKKARETIDLEAQTAFRNLHRGFFQGLRFLSRRAQNGAAATTDQLLSHPAVNDILQNVVYGKKEVVRTALEELKNNNPMLLQTVLISTATQPIIDYSSRSTVNQTLLQAAASAGDVAINPSDEGMCEMIASYLSADEVATQFTELFPDGIEAHVEDQKRQSQTDFEPMLQAVKQTILAERSPDPRNPDDPNNNLNATLNKNATNELYIKIETLFRQPYTALSHREKIFNPCHLLRALEVYNELWNQLESDGSDRDYKKRDLFWRQIVGYIQRFVPACYAQALAQGLYYLVKVDQDASWHPVSLSRDLKLKYDNFLYFPLHVGPCSGLGFDFAIYGAGCLPVCARRARHGVGLCLFSKTFVEQKYQAFGTLCREFECNRATSLMNVVA